MWAIASRSASLRCGIAAKSRSSSRRRTASYDVAQLAEQVPRVVLVPQHRVARRRLALDDRQRRVDPLLTLLAVLLGLRAEVVDV